MDPSAVLPDVIAMYQEAHDGHDVADGAGPVHARRRRHRRGPYSTAGRPRSRRFCGRRRPSTRSPAPWSTPLKRAGRVGGDEPPRGGLPRRRRRLAVPVLSRRRPHRPPRDRALTGQASSRVSRIRARAPKVRTGRPVARSRRRRAAAGQGGQPTRDASRPTTYLRLIRMPLVVGARPRPYTSKVPSPDEQSTEFWVAVRSPPRP